MRIEKKEWMGYHKQEAEFIDPASFQSFEDVLNDQVSVL
jgi:hypothetical protein